MDLVHLAPGIVNGTDMRLRKAPFNAAPSQFSTDGAGNNNNEFTIDGVSNTFSDGTAPRVAFAAGDRPSPSSACRPRRSTPRGPHTRVRWSTSAPRAEPNELHGSAWWWLRHSMFDAPTIFQNRSGQKLPIYQDNRYGVSPPALRSTPEGLQRQEQDLLALHLGSQQVRRPQRGRLTSTVPRGVAHRRFLRPAGHRRQLPALRSRDHRAGRRRPL
jgi:hypothetical protein